MAQGKVATYDFKQCLVMFGTDVITGFAEGDDAVSVEQETELYTKQTGADGEVTRSRMNNDGGKVTIKLQASSPSNDVFNASAQADRVSGSGKKPLFIKDGSGRSLHTIAEGWVSKLPNAQYGSGSGTREWVIECGSIVSNIGGNN
jgi:hypothetical protein